MKFPAPSARVLGDPSPKPPGIYRFTPKPAGSRQPARAAVNHRPSLRYLDCRRRSGCIPAEPYPPGQPDHYERRWLTVKGAACRFTLVRRGPIML